MKMIASLGSAQARLFSFAGLCCTNALRDSLHEFRVIAGEYEQLVPYEVQDQELAFLQHSVEAARIAVDLV